MPKSTYTQRPQVLPFDDLPAQRLGLGTMQLTGPGHWGAPANPEEAMRVLRDAVEAGVTHIDTADAYGPFTAEKYIRKALRPYRDGLVIATKGGLTRQGPDQWSPCGRPEYLRQCVEMSLRRLQVDRIDLYYLHRVDPAVPMSDQLGVLADMQVEGKIHHIGLSKVDVAEIQAASGMIDVAAVQNKYSANHRGYEEVLNYCDLNEIPFVPYAPLASGRLAEPDSVLDELAVTYETTPAQLALAWLLHRSSAVMPIPGTSSPVHLRENLAAADLHLTPEDVLAIDAVIRGHLPPRET